MDEGFIDICSIMALDVESISPIILKYSFFSKEIIPSLQHIALHSGGQT
jgi:hypothetical protein